MGTGSSVVKTNTNARRPMNLQGRILATYQLIPSFKYSEKLDCYVDDLSLLDPSLPSPTPPTTKKVDIFDLRRYGNVDKRALEAPRRFLKQSLQDLVEYLADGLDNDVSKIRVIYRWITCQAIDTISMRKEPPPSQVLYQLWRIKKKKGNYAQLVSLLCRYAEIPCVIIHGQLKGSTYQVGDNIDEDVHYGEWNAVLIDKQWRFINAYWGTCAEGTDDDTPSFGEEDTKLFYACDENYFLTDPEHLVSTHLPSKPKWQLKKRTLTAGEFGEMTFLKDRYFNLHLRIISHPKCIVRSDSGEVQLKLALPPKKSLDLEFQYLMFRLRKDQEKRYDRFVFLHKTNNQETLCIKVRSPTTDSYRFELVARDNSAKKGDSNGDYDWVAIYKLVFDKPLETCQPFPVYPLIGWGPGHVARDAGLAPLSHFSGEIMMDDHGKVEIHFGATNKDLLGDMLYTGTVHTGGAKQKELTDCVVHRVENGDVVFNVMTPFAGEFVLKLEMHRKGKHGETLSTKEWCNYFLVSKQREVNTAFPRGFNEKLGPQNPAFLTSGLHPSKPSGFIKTEKDEVRLVFTREKDIELSVNMSGERVRSADAPKLMSQDELGDEVIYIIRLPEAGQYGVRVRGTCKDGAPHDSLYDYVIDYRKGKTRTKKQPSIKQEAELFSPTDTLADVLRRRTKMASEEHDKDELESAIKDMKDLNLASVRQDITEAERELQVIEMTKALTKATDDRDAKKLKSTLKAITKAGLEERLSDEILFANLFMERLKKLQRVLKQVLALDQCTLAEIRAYNHPPEVVQKVMQAVLLLLGHWEEETRRWKNILITLGKTGKEAIKRKIAEIDVHKIPPEVALGAKDFIQDVDIDIVRLVSVGCATFYLWVKEVVEEVEKQEGDNITNVRPRTSKKQRKREKTMIIEEA